ncbi:MAG: hypothetical protein RW306_15875 [Geobacteraceae bacterium]|nr:hypothetical protein [Geobacteraceae bacterium]
MRIIDINFADFGGPIYVGRTKGGGVRKKYKLNELDSSDVKVNVFIPDNTVSINSSFFLAMFGDSIRAAGGREEFLSKFTFTSPDHLWESIERDISRALQEREMLL